MSAIPSVAETGARAAVRSTAPPVHITGMSATPTSDECTPRTRMCRPVSPAGSTSSYIWSFGLCPVSAR
eukprot:15451553-Alexandrium_andersonii.AAC.1